MRVNLKFDDIQFQRLQTVAQSQGMRPGSWARRAVVLALSQELPATEKTETRDLFETATKKTKRKKRKAG